MKILELRAENIKRLSVVQITPDGHLVEITGANGEGKTSVLDSIWYALGGDRVVPDKPIRKGAKSARVEVKLGDQDGVRLIVERTFTEKGSYLSVRGADGAKFGSPQTMMNDLMGAIGFDPLTFMRLDDKEQFEMLRRIVKLDVDIDLLDRKRAGIFDDRTVKNREHKAAVARAEAIVVPDDLPEDPPDRQAILDKMTNASVHNEGVREKERNREDAAERQAELEDALKAMEQQVQDAHERVRTARENLEGWIRHRAEIEAEALPPLVDVAEVRLELERADVLAEGFRRQQAKIDAEAQATTLARQADELTAAMEAIDKQKREALASAKMPIEGLSFEGGKVTFNALPLAQASASQQLRVSAAIGAALNPKLRVILARDGSLLDSKALEALGTFAQENDMQVWLERVDESGQVGIVMEDGHVKGQEELVAEHEKAQAEDTATTGQQPATGVAPPTDDAIKRAEEYLTMQLAALGQVRTSEDAERLNAQVKVKLKRFQQIVSAKWTTPYLERMKRLSGK